MEKIAIIGGGSAGIFAASFLDTSKHEVVIYEKTARLGRKFLVAGHGGLNLSQNATQEQLKSTYRPAGFIDEYIDLFDDVACRQYFDKIGVSTFIGTSGKIFPTDLKPAQVLDKIIATFPEVTIHTKAIFEGFNDGKPVVNGEVIEADYYIFALGGCSWSKTGSDGHWTTAFQELGISIEPFLPSNCGWKIDWHTDVLDTLSGKPLKNITIHVGVKSQKGEALITDYGIEGGAVYRMTYAIRGLLSNGNQPEIHIDLKPKMPQKEIVEILKNRKKSISHTLKNVLRLEDEKIGLINHFLTKEEYADAEILAERLKRFPLKIIGLAPVDEAISTVGGVNLLELNNDLSLKKYPHIFCIGEMLDYDTITGGYLLQSCMSMAYFLAQKINH